MTSITRRKFFVGVGAITAAATLPIPAAGQDAQSSEWTGGDAESGAFRLSLSPGLKNTRIQHPASGLILADADYSYSFERPTFQQNRLTTSDDGSASIHFQGSTWGGSLEILHKFHLPHNRPWLEEEITLANRSSLPLDLSGVRCGFVLPLELEAAKVSGIWKNFKVTAVPYRRAPQGSNFQYADFSLDQILNEEFRSELMTYDVAVTPTYASEGWAWTDGKRGFLLSKYSQHGMEWSILDRVPLGKSGRVSAGVALEPISVSRSMEFGLPPANRTPSV